MPITTPGHTPAPWSNQALIDAESVMDTWNTKSDKAQRKALVQATIGVAREIEHLRESLIDLLDAHGPIAGMLDELVSRVAPEGDSLTEALVQIANAVDNANIEKA